MMVDYSYIKWNKVLPRVDGFRVVRAYGLGCQGSGVLRFQSAVCQGQLGEDSKSRGGNGNDMECYLVLIV